MTIRIQADTNTEGVSHAWFADLKFGTLDFGYTGHANHLYFHDPADIDAVIAELTALRAEMTAEMTAKPEPCPCGSETCTETLASVKA